MQEATATSTENQQDNEQDRWRTIENQRKRLSISTVVLALIEKPKHLTCK